MRAFPEILHCWPAGLRASPAPRVSSSRVSDPTAGKDGGGWSLGEDSFTSLSVADLWIVLL